MVAGVSPVPSQPPLICTIEINVETLRDKPWPVILWMIEHDFDFARIDMIKAVKEALGGDEQ